MSQKFTLKRRHSQAWWLTPVIPICWRLKEEVYRGNWISNKPTNQSTKHKIPGRKMQTCLSSLRQYIQDGATCQDGMPTASSAGCLPLHPNRPKTHVWALRHTDALHSHSPPLSTLSVQLCWHSALCATQGLFYNEA